MKKIILYTLLLLVVAALAFYAVKSSKKPKEDFMEYFGTSYSDMISFIVEGYQCHWNGCSPEDMNLSSVYQYESPDAGFVQYDIDKDGVDELILGDQQDNGAFQIYDIFTFDRTTGDTPHVFCGGERDWCTLSEDCIITENGSNSADDSFTKHYVLKKLKLKEAKASDKGLLPLQFDKFSKYATPAPQLCGGYTEQREPSEEELALFSKVTEGQELSLTPKSVATQVVAGTNYKFLCEYEDKSAGKSGNCFVIIYEPLQGDPVLSEIDTQE